MVKVWEMCGNKKLRGSLRTMLDTKNIEFTIAIIVSLAKDIALGMMHLHAEKVGNKKMAGK